MLSQLIINVLQKLLFCVVKTAVLHGKSVGFASQNSRFRNAKTKLSFFIRIIFTKSRCFSYLTQAAKRKIISPKMFCFSSIFTIRKRRYTNGITPFISNITMYFFLNQQEYPCLHSCCLSECRSTYKPHQQVVQSMKQDSQTGRL